MALLRIQTTQNVTIEYETASVGERIAATLLDGLVQVGWVIACALIGISLDSVTRSLGETGSVILMLSLVGLPLFLYHLLSEALWNGQSIGKRLMKIRVISLNGAPPRFTQYLLRWVLRLVDIQLFSGIVALIAVVASERGQRVGDIAAGTSVVRLRPREAADNSLFGTDYDPDYRVRYPEVAALSDHDVRLIQELVTQSERRGTYHILADVAHRVRTITGIPASTRPDHEFLLIVLRDYAHLAAQTADR